MSATKSTIRGSHFKLEAEQPCFLYAPRRRADLTHTDGTDHSRGGAPLLTRRDNIQRAKGS